MVRLLITQRNHGVDAHGAARGNVRGEECDGEKQERHGGERQRVGCVDAVEHRGYKARDANRRGDADSHADEHEKNSLADDELQQIATLSAERYANAEFARATNNFIGKQSIKPDASEKQRQSTEKRRKSRDQSLLIKQLINLPGLAFEIGKQKIVVHLAYGIAN